MKRLKYRTISSFGVAVAAVSLLGATGCNKNGTADLSLSHKLVATGGQHSIPMYPDEPTFLKVASKAQEGGINGAVGDVQKQIEAKEIDDLTPVEILSSDQNGDEVRITSGPLSGQVGFVAPQNVS